MTIRIASKEDANAIKELFKEVFNDDPLIDWFLLKGCRRPAASESFYKFMISTYCLPHGLCWVTPDITGAALWIPPGKWELPLHKQLSMTGVIVRSFGWRKVILKFRERLKIDRCHPREPHYYLSGLGVREEHRRRGAGSALIRPILDQSDREGKGCYLETSLERNLNFYRRHGFSITRQLSIGPARIPVWLMWREPRKSR